MKRLLVLLLLPFLLAGCSLFHRKRVRPPYKKVTPSIAYEMMRDNPEMLIIDLRPVKEYNGETGHIRRALSVPLKSLTYKLLELKSFREDTVLVYCHGNDDCGEKGVEFLLNSGFENVVLMDGGIDKWIRGDFKTVLPAEIAGRPASALPDDGRGAIMPIRPGKPSNDVTVEPPPPPLPQ